MATSNVFGEIMKTSIKTKVLKKHIMSGNIRKKKMFSQRCRAHLKDVNESGLQHAKHALIFAAKLQLLVPAVVVHAFVPGLFTRTATRVMSNMINERTK